MAILSPVSRVSHYCDNFRKFESCPSLQLCSVAGKRLNVEMRMRKAEYLPLILKSLCESLLLSKRRRCRGRLLWMAARMGGILGSWDSYIIISLPGYKPRGLLFLWQTVLEIAVSSVVIIRYFKAEPSTPPALHVPRYGYAGLLRLRKRRSCRHPAAPYGLSPQSFP